MRTPSSARLLGAAVLGLVGALALGALALARAKEPSRLEDSGDLSLLRAFSRRSDRFAATFSSGDTTTVRVWSVPEGALLARYVVHGRVHALAFSSTGERLAFLIERGRDGVVEVRSALGAGARTLEPLAEAARGTLVFAPGDAHLALFRPVFGDGVPRVWDLASGRLLDPRNCPEAHPGPWLPMPRPVEDWLARATPDPHWLEKVRFRSTHALSYGLASSSDGGLDDGPVRFVAAIGGEGPPEIASSVWGEKPLALANVEPGSAPIALSPRGTLVVTGGPGWRSLAVTRTRDGTIVASLAPPVAGHLFRGAVVSPDDELLLTEVVSALPDPTRPETIEAGLYLFRLSRP